MPIDHVAKTYGFALVDPCCDYGAGCKAPVFGVVVYVMTSGELRHCFVCREHIERMRMARSFHPKTEELPN